MASTVPLEYLVVFLRAIRGLSNNSWKPCVHLVLRILDTVLGWWISKNGIEMAGPIMQKVRPLPLHGSTCTSQFSSGLFICRDLAFAKARHSAHSHPLWLYEPKLAFCPTRHRIVLRDACELCGC